MPEIPHDETSAREAAASEAPIRRVSGLEGERTISPVAGRPALGGGGKALTLLALIAGSGVFLAATWGHTGRAKPPADPPPARQVVTYEGPRPILAAAASDPNAPTLTAGGAPGAGTAGRPEAALGDGATGATTPAPAQGSASLAAAAQRAPLIAFSRGGPGAGGAGEGAPADGIRPAEAAGGELDQLRRGSTIGLARAARLPDRNFLIVAGTSLPCVLQTAMDTSTPGYVSCVVPVDVWSDNGAVVLLEKGARVLGEYRSGMRQGQRRLFVLWDRAVTPAGVAIALASPASDSLGRAGFDGELDNHFWARFGGALMLSIVDGAASAAAGSNDRYPGVVRLPSDAAGVALQNSINITPTLRKAQGAEVSIFVAQDLDFADVYGLQAR